MERRPGCSGGDSLLVRSGNPLLRVYLQLAGYAGLGTHIGTQLFIRIDVSKTGLVHTTKPLDELHT